MLVEQILLEDKGIASSRGTIQKNTGLSFSPSIACTTSADEAASCWQSAKDVNYNDHPK